MFMVVAPDELVGGTRLLTEAIHMHIREFRQPALVAIPSMQDPLALLPLFVQQPGDGFLTLLSLIGIASDRN
jgi:hypothetical protein